MLTESVDPAVDSVGVDIGTVSTKIALGASAHPWQGDTPAGSDLAAGLRHCLVRAAGSLRPAYADFPAHANIVVAVPDRWTVRGPDDPLIPVEHSTEGRRLQARWEAEQPGTLRMVSGMLCLAASFDGPDGCLLLCDVGASNIVAAVCLRTGTEVRLIDVECADVGAADPVALLLAPGDTRGSPGTRAAALHAERRRRSDRARVLLPQAARLPRYREATVYPPGAHGDSIQVGALITALEPLAELATRVLARLLARTTEPLLPELILSGGNVVGPVVTALTAATGGRTRTVRVLDPAAAASGALRLAHGRVHAEASTPGTIGLLAQRIRHGLLESLVLAVPQTAAAPLELEIDESDAATPQVRRRSLGETQWTACEPVSQLALSPGRYAVFVNTRQSVHGVLRFRSIHDGTITDIPVGPAIGQ